ncbi:hypothetical protein F4806DRAFT_152683 [Annulohypoxylon nitens]|nr:hypothetical protein F4806DRAFT_152683 [Annulohypoxylon nitens]
MLGVAKSLLFIIIILPGPRELHRIGGFVFLSFETGLAFLRYPLRREEMESGKVGCWLGNARQTEARPRIGG